MIFPLRRSEWTFSFIQIEVCRPSSFFGWNKVKILINDIIVVVAVVVVVIVVVVVSLVVVIVVVVVVAIPVV